MHRTPRASIDDFFFGLALVLALLDAAGLCAVVLFGHGPQSVADTRMLRPADRAATLG